MGAICGLAWIVAAPAFAEDRTPVLPTAQARPYLFNAEHRARTRRLIANEGWASDEYRRVQRKAAQGDGYWAAFLYALERDPRHLATARDWLLTYGRRGGDLQRSASQASPAFFAGPRPWLGDVYYRIDVKPLVAFDWTYNGLTAAERAVVESGILASAQFRRRAIDRWPQTPNLVLKPSYMVAMAGLVTDDEQSKQWGYFRQPGSPQGGYFHALNVMLRDGGVWGEAPLYPISHQSLLLMARMSRYLSLIDDDDWFSRTTPHGGSPQALMDYFIDTAYPTERVTGDRRRIRIASYGDGATGPATDLFLINQSGHRYRLHDELAAAYANTRHARYAAFLSMVPDYRANLTDRAPLPATAPLPSAPSKVWPSYGLAMLRSDESAGYWHNPDAIAVLQIMSQGYGHDHRDKFAITLHGAGQLLYPDYNAVQYENPAIGWTRHTIAHNTLTVDGRDARNAPVTASDHDFSAEVKFLTTSSHGVFRGVDQTRILMLTKQYLLDVFHAKSLLPHRFEYLLHSFGRPEPVTGQRFTPTDEFQARYWGMIAPQASRTGESWSLDFVLDAAAWDTYFKYVGEQLHNQVAQSYVQDRPLHKASVRVTAAAAKDTTLGYGRGRHGLGMLIARRDAVHEAQFTLVHEPYRDRPAVTRVEVVAGDDRALVVRIVADDYTDYAAAALMPQADHALHVLQGNHDPQIRFAFARYGWMRIHRNGRVVARGDWQGIRVPTSRPMHTIDGVTTKTTDGYLEHGKLASAPPRRRPGAAPAAPIDVPTAPSLIRMRAADRAATSITLRNVSNRSIDTRVAFTAARGMEIAPNPTAVTRLDAGATIQVPVAITTRNADPGWVSLRYRTAYRHDGGKWHWTRSRGLAVAVGAVLQPIYDFPNPPVYRVHAPDYVVELDMHHGLIRRLIHADGTTVLDREPLFTLADDQQMQLFTGTKTAFTWTVESPAEVVAHANDRLRWRARFLDDRIQFGLIPEWARSERVYVHMPGTWVPKSRWRRGLTSLGERTFDEPGAAPDQLPVTALEQEIDARDWSLCVNFSTPQPVTIVGTGVHFSLPTQSRDTWSVGFCPRGGLAGWAGQRR